MKDILERLANSSATESSHELQCRCFDAAEEISRLREELIKTQCTALDRGFELNTALVKLRKVEDALK